MNRTLTINISGIIFHVEEDAYEKLNRYLSTIRSYFSASEGRDEIMADIEARIAELLKEKVTDAKQVILMNDVDQVISVMGKPEDFADEASEQSGYSQATYSAPISGTKRKRVFRDPDDKILGGVCSGISAYFDYDPMWLRIIWAILAIFSFGTFVFIYILLWIILPEAKTTAEKLEMRGEKVNISNIEKSIKEELDGLKKKVNDLKNDTGQAYGRKHTFLHDLANFIKTVVKGVFIFISKIVYVLLIFISLILLIALLAAIFGSTNVIHINTDNVDAHYSLYQVLYSIFGNATHVRLSALALFLFACVPLIMVLYKAISRLAGVRKNIRAVNLTATFLWIAGVVLSFYLLSVALSGFKERGVSEQTITLAQPTSEVLYLNVDGSSKWNFNRNKRGDFWTFFRWNEGDKSLGLAQLDIQPSPTDSFAVVVKKISRGATKKEAMSYADELRYNFKQNDTVIDFSNFFELSENAKWKAQQVELTLLVPFNKKIYLNKNMNGLIYDVENIHYVYDGDMVGRTWIMTENGLDCVDCRGLELRKEERHNVHVRINEEGDNHGINIDIHENDPSEKGHKGETDNNKPAKY